MKHAKEDLLQGYGAESSLELSDRQLDELIDYLRDIINRKDDGISKGRRKHMHQCLRIMADIGINTQDWNQVNKFMLNKHVCGRHLYQLNLQELINFKRKLYAIQRKVEEKRNNEKRLANMN